MVLFVPVCNSLLHPFNMTNMPQALLPSGLQWRMSQQLCIPELLLSLYMPSPRAVPWQTGKDPLGPYVLQGRSCCQVVQKYIPSGSGHWCFLHPNLGRIRTTIPAALLPCKHESGRDQRFGRNFLSPRKSDSGRLSGQCYAVQTFRQNKWHFTP